LRGPIRTLALLLGLAILGVTAPGGAAAPPDGETAAVTVTGPAGATLLLDGDVVGTLPLAHPLAVAPGRHELAARLRGMRPWQRRFTAAGGDAWRFHVPPLPLRRREAVLGSLILAGSGQRYLGRRRLGWILTGAELAGGLAGVLGEIAFQNHRDDYLAALADYRAAVNQDEIVRLRRRVESEYADMNDARDLRDAGWTVAAAAVVVSVLDAWLRFPHMAAGPGLVPPPPDTGDAGDGGPVTWPDGRAALHLGWRLEF